MAKNRRKRCIHKYINIEFMEEKMKKDKRIVGPIKEFFKNTFGNILENEESDEDLKREVEVIKSTKLDEGQDYIIKNKKTDKKSNSSGIKRDIKLQNKTIVINEKNKYKNKKYDREIGE